MKPKETKEMIENSLMKLKWLYWDREQRERDMGKLHLAIRGLLNLVEDKAEREGYRALLDTYRVRTGLSDLIVLALSTFDHPLTPTQIRDFIRDYGSEASEQQNLLQSIHTTLKRLEDDRVKEVVNKSGEKAYQLMRLGERMLRILKGTDSMYAERVGKRMERLNEIRRIPFEQREE
ncbi:MAG TPA: hypothetical protein VKY85_18420 [Candidatus Angelobacter sp.]|nr:hypothetical protein [Candidatus Angelobacter sp.]